MKLLLIIHLHIFALTSFSQEIHPPAKKVYKVFCSIIQGGKNDGFLAGMSDSTISLVKDAAFIRTGLFSDRDINKFNYQQIEKIIVRRKGSTGRGIVYGMLTGVTTGVLIGLLSGSDQRTTYTSYNGYQVPNMSLGFSSGEKALFYGTGGMLGGALIGGIVGGIVRKSFYIRGKKEAFTRLGTTMQEKFKMSR